MNFPNDFERNMRALLKSEYDDFEASYAKPHFSALRVNSRKIDDRQLALLLDESDSAPGDLRVPWAEHGFYYNDVALDSPLKDGSCLNVFSPGKSPLHEAGLYYIQEPSAMLPVTLLDVDDSGLKVLDLCAAPGGKTTQIADYMKGKGLLVANEIVPQRSKILSENIERMGVKNAIVISADPKDIADRFEGFFDRILVDAPCSGEGMFRKHPEAIDQWSPENVLLCAERQSYIMDCAAKMLKRGGRMVYSTCTFNEDEDEGSVAGFLTRNPDMRLQGDMHRIFPHRDRGEGHFGAAFIKEGEPFDVKLPKILQPENGIKKSDGLPFLEFANKVLTREGCEHVFSVACSNEIFASDGIFVMFGEQLFYAPSETPHLAGLKVLRPGLHLGMITKGRFEPSHALALFLKPEDVTSAYELDFGGSVSSLCECDRYLKGESIVGECPKGWTLMCVKGYSLGWGKSVGNMIKNHYPKGLRR